MLRGRPLRPPAPAVAELSHGHCSRDRRCQLRSPNGLRRALSFMPPLQPHQSGEIICWLAQLPEKLTSWANLRHDFGFRLIAVVPSLEQYVASMAKSPTEFSRLRDTK